MNVWALLARLPLLRGVWLHGVRFGRDEALVWLNNEGAFQPYDYDRTVG